MKKLSTVLLGLGLFVSSGSKQHTGVKSDKEI